MRPAPAITIVGWATAEGIREAAEAVETPGGYYVNEHWELIDSGRKDDHNM